MIVHLTTDILKLIDYYTSFFKIFPFFYKIPSFTNGPQLNVFIFFSDDNVNSIIY